MSQSIQVNGQTINYPETGDTNWADDATNFAIQTSAALGKIGLSSGTSVDITQTLDVTGNTTLDANLSVGGNASVTGNLTVNGNTQLGNSNTDTIGVTGIVNVDSGVLYVDPVNNRVGINNTTPSEALDITGNIVISGNGTVSGNLGVTGNLSVNGNTTIGNASSDTITINSNSVSIPNGLNIDSNTLVVDATNNRIGIVNATPLKALDVIGDITYSLQLLNSDGLVSLPSITFNNDNNSGLYRIGSDKIGFSANGARQGEFGVGYGGFTGNVIQVLQTSIDTQLSTGSTSYVDITGLSIAITPKYSTSKILIRFKLNGSNSGTSNLNAYQILRDSTAIGNGNIGSRRKCHTAVRGSIGDPNSSFVASGEFLDSPSTISSITYKIQWLVDGGTGYINRDNGNVDNINYPSPLSSITVMEIQQ